MAQVAGMTNHEAYVGFSSLSLQRCIFHAWTFQHLIFAVAQPGVSLLTRNHYHNHVVTESSDDGSF